MQNIAKKNRAGQGVQHVWKLSLVRIGILPKLKTMSMYTNKPSSMPRSECTHWAADLAVFLCTPVYRRVPRTLSASRSR